MGKTTVARALLAIGIAVSVASNASAQSSASNKRVFAYNPDGVSVTSFFDRVELFNLADVIKTSSNGSLLLGLSMECSLCHLPTALPLRVGGARTQRVPERR